MRSSVASHTLIWGGVTLGGHVGLYVWLTTGAMLDCSELWFVAFGLYGALSIGLGMGLSGSGRGVGLASLAFAQCGAWLCMWLWISDSVGMPTLIGVPFYLMMVLWMLGGAGLLVARRASLAPAGRLLIVTSHGLLMLAYVVLGAFGGLFTWRAATTGSMLLGLGWVLAALCLMALSTVALVGAAAGRAGGPVGVFVLVAANAAAGVFGFGAIVAALVMGMTYDMPVEAFLVLVLVLQVPPVYLGALGLADTIKCLSPRPAGSAGVLSPD